jgi:hypothetical protein
MGKRATITPAIGEGRPVKEEGSCNTVNLANRYAAQIGKIAEISIPIGYSLFVPNR